MAAAVRLGLTTALRTVGPAPARLTARRFASAAKATVAYGAPFTNSISLTPGAAYSGIGIAVPGADQFKVSLSIPDLPMCTLTVFGRDTLDYVAQQIAERLGIKKVYWVLNGRKLLPGTSLSDAGEPATLNAAFGNSVELEVDGVRYSINEGNTLNALGKASKRSLAKTYAFVGVGGVSMLVGLLWFWSKVVPKESQRRMQ